MMVRFGFHPCFSSSASARALLHDRDRAGHRISRPVHPGVVMIAADHPLVRILRARNPHDHVVDGFGESQLNFTFRCTFAGPGPE